eukprot:TRINITY_DN4689_c0_g2_i3.p3 TRINITY_DN4689_c0_g2~~TRINITY_DN4689_c0_g2_i3.p3  ORF type:complete len:152 (-),score=0.41 TRINITY_DN4689_c0_g2_i3:568-969(-)
MHLNEMRQAIRFNKILLHITIIFYLEVFLQLGNKGVYNQGVTLYQKAFWVQAEASLGFWRAYLISGQRDYLEKMKATLIWYRDYHLSQLGEFYWYSDIYDSYRGLDLYGPWKASYHNMRCLLTMLDEIESYLQ